MFFFNILYLISRNIIRKCIIYDSYFWPKKRQRGCKSKFVTDNDYKELDVKLMVIEKNMLSGKMDV